MSRGSRYALGGFLYHVLDRGPFSIQANTLTQVQLATGQLPQ